LQSPIWNIPPVSTRREIRQFTFIRHNFNESRADVPELLKKKIIGIHFNNEYKDQFEDYEDHSRGFVSAYRHFDNLGGRAVW